MTDTRPAAMPEDWNRALAVVAHPDDLEYGAAGAIARWTRQGKSVVYVLASRGEAGIDSLPPEEAGQLRMQEQLASAKVVGVHEVEFLHHPDGLIENGIPLRRDIAEAVRRHQPELVVTLNHRETFPGGGFNMADHRHVGAAVLDAVRDAANRWLFRDLDVEPWSGVRWVAVCGSPVQTHAVDITGTFDLAVASLREHKTYLAALGGEMAEPEPFLRQFAAVAGESFGVPLACTFELFPI